MPGRAVLSSIIRDAQRHHEVGRKATELSRRLRETSRKLQVLGDIVAREELGWRPLRDFGYVLDCLLNNEDPRSRLARCVGAKGYHAAEFSEGPYPVETR